MPTAAIPQRRARSLQGTGFEPLLAWKRGDLYGVAQSLTTRVTALPNLPGLAENPDEKLAVARAWLRSWSRGPGIWFGGMPPNWWTTEVRSHASGEFKAMERVLRTKDVRRIFKKDWLPRLMQAFTERLPEGGTRFLARNLSLDLGGAWERCTTCKSVRRPIPNVATCVDCGENTAVPFDPSTDSVLPAGKSVR